MPSRERASYVRKGNKRERIMAKASNMTAKCFKLVLMLSLLLIISMADGSLSGAFGSSKKDLTITCASVHGVEAGDTCFSVAQHSKLSAEDFSAINPNLDCDELFVGQWLCVAGSA